MKLEQGFGIFDFDTEREKWATGNFIDPNSPFFSEHVEIHAGKRNSKSPPDQPHFHSKTQEFYFVFSGQLTLLVNDQKIVLFPLQLLAISPLVTHAIVRAIEVTQFVVIKSPSGLKDKVIVP